MAATATYVRDLVMGNARARIYTIAHDSGTSTSVDITPGAGFSNPIGNYTNYTVSGNTFTFTIIDGAASSYSTIIFFQI